MEWQWLIWLGIMILFLIVEGLTPYLITIWISAGAFVAMILSLFGVNPWINSVVFAVVSVAFLAGVRPFVKKRLKQKLIPTNADSSIGKNAIVITEIDNTAGAGEVKLGGQMWTARSEDGSTILKDETVVVKSIEGVKLIVAKS